MKKIICVNMKKIICVNMKKIICVFLCLCMLTGILTGCGSNSGSGSKLNVVVTIFPVFDWVREILGDGTENVNLTMLLDDGVDLHSFQPTAEDIIKISTCDLFIYVGGESDAWVDGALQEATNKSMVVLNLLSLLGTAVKTEESVAGMQEEDHDHEDHDQQEEVDEHVWLSLQNAKVLCKKIADKLCDIDAARGETYTANLAAYTEKLTALDGAYQAAVENAARKTLLFGDRFPFRYLVDDYGLTYYAAFAGCSAETEASFETVTFLANKVDDLKLPCVLAIEGTSHRVAQTIVASTTAKNQQILFMDSLQSTVAKDVHSGTTYLSAMENNLETLKAALK